MAEGSPGPETLSPAEVHAKVIEIAKEHQPGDVPDIEAVLKGPAKERSAFIDPKTVDALHRAGLLTPIAFDDPDNTIGNPLETKHLATPGLPSQEHVATRFEITGSPEPDHTQSWLSLAAPRTQEGVDLNGPWVLRHADPDEPRQSP